MRRWSSAILVLFLLGWTGTTIVTALVRGDGHGAVFVTALVFLGLVFLGLLILLRRIWRQGEGGSPVSDQAAVPEERSGAGLPRS